MRKLLDIARLTLLLVLSLTAGELWTPRPEPGSILPALPAAEASRPDDEWVLSDIDGDSRADRATGNLEQSGSYKLRIYFSSGLEEALFYFGRACPGIRVLSLDIDLDDDHDLVIDGADGIENIVVWLNDGHGRFLRGESREYGRIPCAGLRSGKSMGPESSESCDPGMGREIPNAWLRPGGWAKPDRSESFDFYSRPFPSEFLACASSARSPPNLFLV